MALEVALLVISMTVFSLWLQANARIPSPMTLIVLALLLKWLPDWLPFSLPLLSNSLFDQIVFLLLPMLLAIDVLHLQPSDLKKHAVSLFYVAVIAVVMGIFLCAYASQWILPNHSLPMAALVALFCMVMATDPITVSAVFGQQALPKDLKVLAEGESLVNDATALLVFSLSVGVLTQSHKGIELSHINADSLLPLLVFCAMGLSLAAIGAFLLKKYRHRHIAFYWQMGFALIFAYGMHALVNGLPSRWLAGHWLESTTLPHNVMAVIPSLIAKPVLGAIAIGLGVGALIACLIRWQKRINSCSELTAWTLLAAYSAYYLAEHQHWSGILAVIVAVLLTGMAFPSNQVSINKQRVLDQISGLSTFGVTILFLSMGSLVDIGELWTYRYEIVSVFIASTLVRMIMLKKFRIISKTWQKMMDIQVHWWLVLSAAGVKGALSLLMLHMMPQDAPYMPMIEAIVIGNILLSTFIYPFVIMAILSIYQARFEKDLCQP